MEIILKLFSFFLFLFYVPTPSPCPDSHCLRSGPAIRFPFRLSNQTGPGSCGAYPGFDLISCGASKETIIHIQSLPFIVREIDYIAQQIKINDPDNCLPGKILSLNFDLPGILFRAAFYKEFSFFSCSSGHRRPELRPIECLSNGTHSVYATSSPSVRSDLIGACDVVKTVYVPVESPSFGGDVPPSVLFQDLVLQWDSPDCQRCERNLRRCGLKGGPGTEIDCFDDLLDWFMHVVKVFGVTVLIIVCLVIGCSGFHGAIKSFGSGPKIEVRDTCSQPNPDGPKCTICLSGFRAQEALKTLKPCKHSFHTKCIDKWLLQNDTCPVCRGVKQHTTVSLK